MSDTSSTPPLDASGVLTWRLLNFLAGQRPSAQEKRGSRRLDDARKLARENESQISPRDMEVVRDRINLTEEIKDGLDSKKFFSKYLQAREYRKCAKETLRFVKRVSDRANDARLGERHSDLRAEPFRPGPVDCTDLADTCINARQLGAAMKPSLATLVENMYGFSTSHAHSSIGSNAKLAQTLLRDMNFVYSEVRNGENRHGPYRHPIIQRAINITWFRDKDDVGVVNHEHFSPMPVPAITLTLTVIECCIDEWSDGTWRNSSWDDEKFRTVYNSHVSSLFEFHGNSLAGNRDMLEELQHDLLKNAREHAGVSPDPITNSGRFTPGALDAVREESRQLISPLPPSYDEIPEIVVGPA